ncbi:MAG: 4'-phosphopantetheinyl transferase superfamily protein [Pyrinomonadaceae bacterium]|nr:4'-phosphopantetheinyl transferase superfamily protein [Pyrinomonadaceae bacterium]
MDQSARTLDQMRSTLSTDEQVRANRFHFERDREHFIIARGLLRTILATYVDAEPAQINFSYSAYGKPALTTNPSSLSFNLSHSHGHCLLAVVSGRQVGVDIEMLRDDLAHEEIAERYFSPREASRFRALPKQLYTAAFFNCWTRKEAFVKAHGKGLSLGLDQFDVSFVPGEPARLEYVQEPLNLSNWSLSDIHVGDRYAAAVVVEGPACLVHSREWPLPV